MTPAGMTAAAEHDRATLTMPMHHSGASLPPLFEQVVRHIHCVGVGGMGLGPLAIYLAQLGFAVTGEDDGLTADMRPLLERAGVMVGPIPAACDLLVFSSAISEVHPARRAAEARGVPLVRRGILLAELARGKKLVAICGSHGKTTTTAMLATLVERSGFPAGYVQGGLPADGALPARTGENDWLVAEIDESDGTIAAFAPELTVVVNLDWDHPDHYKQRADLEKTFAALFARTQGTVLINATCPLSAHVAPPGAVTFGPSGDFNGVVARENNDRMIITLAGRFDLEQAEVRARGEFNASNALAALAAAELMGATLTTSVLAEFPGVRRRQTVLAASPAGEVIEDYAHHPAEIAALLTSLRQRVNPPGRLLVVFQPHRFSRTRQFKPDFAQSLALADRVYLLAVYAAGEAPLAGGTSADLQAELQKVAPTLPVSLPSSPEAESLPALTLDRRPGDLIAFVGAGDIDRHARAWLRTTQIAEAARRWDQLARQLEATQPAGTRIKREESLAAKTTMRVGGAARLYAEPAAIDDLAKLLQKATELELAIFPLGRGSNLIIPDEGVDGLVIALTHESWASFAPRPDGRVGVGAGLRLKSLCGQATKAGLAGFEFLEGIPGSVGGALRMNAGAMGGWMFDVVEEVQLVTLLGEVKTLAKTEMHVAYRHCAELHDAIAVGALLRPAAPGEAAGIARQIDVYRKKRHETQPREPSAGCIFKNPPGHSAGRLIDECGLKGERVGDAEVSGVHANFIVNRGQATGADVLELVRRVRARVRQVKGVELEPEVLLYGQAWEKVL